MADKSPIPLSPPPGICFSAANYAAGKDLAYISTGAGSFRSGQGRWANSYNMEFVAGFAQKIAGWMQAIATPMEGIPRAAKSWRDSNAIARMGIGTTTHLYSWLSGVATDVTPLRTLAQGNLTNALTTTLNSPVIAVADSNQMLVNGDWVFISAGTTIGGVQPNGWFSVSGRTATGYNITLAVDATSAVSNGGGTIAYQYPRVTLTNPFSTQINLPTVTVTHAAHGALAGNFVVFSGASAVGGLTINGEYQIVSIIDNNTYTITAGTNATSTASGGGSVSVIYLIQIAQVTSSAAPVWGATGIVWGNPGGWGTNSAFLASSPDGWTLDPYGSQLLACPVGGTIYVVDTLYGGRAYPLLNAPTSINAMFVTPERFVVALGVGTNDMQMAWSDQLDYTQWTALPTNTANSGRTLVGGAYLVGGIAVSNGISLIFTDKCAFAMNYTAGQEIYSTPRVGDNCGLLSPWGVCVEGGIAFWWSDQDWWTWNGSVQALPSDDVRASVFQPNPTQTGINRQQLGKVCAVLNRAKRQVRFYYPLENAGENNAGMIYHYDQQCWSPLAFGRSAGDDTKLLPTPMSTDITGNLFYDETGVDANGAPLPCYIELAEIDLSNGGRNVDVFGFLPNFQTLVGLRPPIILRTCSRRMDHGRSSRRRSDRICDSMATFSPII